MGRKTYPKWSPDDKWHGNHFLTWHGTTGVQRRGKTVVGIKGNSNKEGQNQKLLHRTCAHKWTPQTLGQVFWPFFLRFQNFYLACRVFLLTTIYLASISKFFVLLCCFIFSFAFQKQFLVLLAKKEKNFTLSWKKTNRTRRCFSAMTAVKHETLFIQNMDQISI